MINLLSSICNGIIDHTESILINPRLQQKLTGINKKIEVLPIKEAASYYSYEHNDDTSTKDILGAKSSF